MLNASYHKHILNFNFQAGTSRGVLTEKPSWIIKLYDPANPNIIGKGECSIINGLSPDPNKGYEAMLDKVCSNPAHFLSFSEPELSSFPSIRFGLEMAWLDLRQGGSGLLFSSEFTKGNKGIPINGLIWMDSKENMLQQIRKRIEEGFECIKMKIGAIDFEEELDLLKVIRKEFSTDVIQLRVDANGAFEPSGALEKLKRLSDFNLHSIEQPIKPGNWPAMVALCDNTPLPIALDEELFAPGSDSNKFDLLKTIRPQYLVLKPSMLGGFAKTQEWIEAAKTLNIGWWITSALESNIGLNALAQWTYTLNNPAHHGLGTGKLFVNNFQSKMFIENGFLKYCRDAMHGVSTVNIQTPPGLSDFVKQWKSYPEYFTLQTSGSTGKPKQIRVSRQSMIRSAELTGQVLDLKKGDTALLCMPLEFVAGKMMLVRALVLGLNLLVVKPSSNPLKEVSSETIIDFAAMTPMQVQETLKEPGTFNKLIETKKLIIGGAPVSRQLDNELQQLPGEIFETYGMTETLTHIALRKINGNKRSEFFGILPGIIISTDSRGCLIIHAPHLDDPDIITNDLVEIISPTQFRWLGRADNVINSGGIKIFPEQVEKKLESMIMERFIVTSLPDRKLGEKLVLVIETSNPEKFEVLPEIIAENLGSYENPREIIFIEKFPETSTGKVIRRGIQKLLKS